MSRRPSVDGPRQQCRGGTRGWLARGGLGAGRSSRKAWSRGARRQGFLTRPAAPRSAPSWVTAPKLVLRQLDPKLDEVWRARGGRIGLGAVGAVLVWEVPGPEWAWKAWFSRLGQGQALGTVLQRLDPVGPEWPGMPGRFGTEARLGASWVAALSAFRGLGPDTVWVVTTHPAMA